MIKRLLVTSDLSEHAAYAVHRGALLAEQHKAQLLLFHVIDDEILHQNILELIQKGTLEAADRLLKDAEATLREQANTLAAKHVFNYSVHVEQGIDFVNIIHQARDDQADLIVLGAHGKHFIQDVFLGTTVEKVVRDSDRSVLVVRNPPEDDYARILITVDLSEMSRQTLAFAQSLAPDDSELHILHAYQYPTEEEAAISASTAEQYMENLEEQAKVQLDQFLAEFDFGTQRVERIVKFGYPPAVIRMVAEQQKTDLTLVGVHSHADLRHLLLGSTAEHALRELSCDVLVVRYPPPASNSHESKQE